MEWQLVIILTGESFTFFENSRLFFNTRVQKCYPLCCKFEQYNYIMTRTQAKKNVPYSLQRKTNMQKGDIIMKGITKGIIKEETFTVRNKKKSLSLRI